MQIKKIKGFQGRWWSWKDV